MSELIVEKDGPVRVVTMNRPDKLNAISAAMHEELAYIWARFTADREVRAVVLTGAGRAFSAGGDSDFLKKVNTDPEFRWRSFDEARRIVAELARFPLPLIGAVNGPAVGLGASLTSWCDMCVMADDAYLADPHVRLGVTAGDGAIATWPQTIGAARAKYHLITGDRITADAALQMGLVHELLPAAEVLPAAVALAHRVAALPAPAVRATKRAVNLQLEHHALAVIDYATATEEGHFMDPDLQDNLNTMTKR